mgnify:CR=1 FL=1
MNDQLSSIVIIGFVIFLLYYMTNNLIIGIFIILIIITIYKYNNRFKPIFNKLLKTETTEYKHYNNDILYNLDKIKKYKKYNNHDYDLAIKYFDKFTKTLHTLENRKLKHKKQYIENAKLYLNKTINHFQNITYSIPDKNLINALKYGDYTVMKKSKKLHKYIDELYKTSYHILFTLTHKNNEKVIENPDIHKSVIDLNVPEPSNYYNQNELY